MKKKTVEHECDGDTNWNWCERIDNGTGGFGNKRTTGDHSNDSLIGSDQNTKESPGDLRKLAVTQTPVKKHQLSMVWKPLKWVNNNNNNDNNNTTIKMVYAQHSTSPRKWPT